MNWSVTLKTETGKKVVTPHPTLTLDAVETKSKILGSLASRWTKGPVRPTSDFPRPPMFSKKRTRQEEKQVQPSRKSTRLAARKSIGGTAAPLDYVPEVYEHGSDDDDDNI